MALNTSPSLLLLLLVAVILLTRPAHAFGAGNIGSVAKIEGVNWRHGDIEDTLLTLLTARAWRHGKFSKMDVKRVYFGNWLRDYSQAVDVGTVKYVSAEAIRLLLWVLGFMSFGYGTEHIDNPKDYADNIDARQYDRRLRGPIDERRELSIDERTGLKHYIATEDIGITTSAGMVRDLFTRCIKLGRRYGQNENEKDFFEALRLLGTASHCLEDYAAHSNYCELALIEMGERNVFPHVGRRTQMQLRGARQPVFPIVTGTFGGVDFLHSVMGELSDKATQSEIQELEGTVKQSRRQDTSMLKELLNKLPSGILGDEDHAGKADQLQANAASAQMENMHISPKQPEAFTRQVDMLARQIYPILEFHDNLVKHISEAMEKIPILPDLLEQLQEQVNVFVFSLIAPYVLPIVNQVKTELQTGSSEVIQSSQEKQLIVFHDDSCTDPTHSMLSKDHFSNVLNEPCGKIASATVAWVIPQIVACWDDESIDIDRTCDRIINGVFHHPALRDYGEDGARDGRSAMFGVVEKWWGELDDRERNQLRGQLSREGVQSGRNHKEGVHDTGHGCGKPIGMPSFATSSSSGAIGGLPVGALMGGLSSVMGGSSGSGGSHGSSSISNMASNAVGGGALGGIVGGLAGNMLGGGFDGADKQQYSQSHQNRDGSRTDKVFEAGHQHGGPHQQDRYGQAEMRHTQRQDGGYQDQYSRYEQDGRHGQTGYGFQQTTDVRPTPGGGYAQCTERRYERPGGTWDSEVQEQRVSAYGQQESHEERRHGKKKKDDSDSDDSDDDSDDDFEKKQKKMRKKEEKRMRKQREDSDSDERRGGGRRRSHGSSGGGSPRHERRGSGGGGRGGRGSRPGSGGGRNDGGFGGFLGDMLGGGGGGGGHGGRGGHRGGGGGGGGRGHRGESTDIEYNEFEAPDNRVQATEQRPEYEVGAEHGGSSYGQEDPHRQTAFQQPPDEQPSFDTRTTYGEQSYGEQRPYEQASYNAPEQYGQQYAYRDYEQQSWNDQQTYTQQPSYGEQQSYGAYSEQQQSQCGVDSNEYRGEGGYDQGDDRYGGTGYGQSGHGDDDGYSGERRY
ncbi:uncharacterized protein LTR77_004451 [Saxophila tyrrhenica]|uniref:Het-C-domain-containing protein n=1 Tax=Saxophila tyrrhenica TaxID=1690608 RepID=A0AAV9PFQ7_9PEZI|nr:hypothetical protein LTR77_004451 [Saxophila tyrrhenica]